MTGHFTTGLNIVLSTEETQKSQSHLTFFPKSKPIDMVTLIINAKSSHLNFILLILMNALCNSREVTQLVQHYIIMTKL